MADSKEEDAFATHGIIVTAKWEWTGAESAGRWSRPQQAIKPKRFYIPQDQNNPNSDGHEVLFSKLKIRGHGKALTIRFESEDGKDFHILGWAVPGTSETTP
jgi:hypothetical protein